MKDPQVQSRGMLMPLLLPSGKPLLVAASPIRFAGEEVPVATPAPRLDEHRASLLAELGMASIGISTACYDNQARLRRSAPDTEPEVSR